MSDTKITCLDMKTVIEVNDSESAQRYINEGWYLLSAGFDTGEDGSTKVYILGNTSKITRKKTKIEVILDEDN